jgi:hypothetical protein
VKDIYLLQVDKEHGKELLRREHGGLELAVVLLILQLYVNATARSLLHGEGNLVLDSLDAFLRPSEKYTQSRMCKSKCVSRVCSSI